MTDTSFSFVRKMTRARACNPIIRRVANFFSLCQQTTNFHRKEAKIPGTYTLLGSGMYPQICIAWYYLNLCNVNNVPLMTLLTQNTSLARCWEIITAFCSELLGCRDNTYRTGLDGSQHTHICLSLYLSLPHTRNLVEVRTTCHFPFPWAMYLHYSSWVVLQ